MKEVWHSISAKTIENGFRKVEIANFVVDEQETARLLRAVNDVSGQISFFVLFL